MEGNEERAFDMHVSVDEARNDRLALAVEEAAGLQPSLEPDDDAVDDRDVTLAPHAGKDVEVAHISQNKIARDLALGGLDSALKGFRGHAPTITPSAVVVDFGRV